MQGSLRRSLAHASITLLALACGLTSGRARADAPLVKEAVEGADPISVEGLYKDLQRLVDEQQAGGWRIDRYEIEDLMSPALMSVCRVKPRVRADLLAMLDARIVGLGGPIESAFEKDPELSHHTKLLFETRIRLLLLEAIKRAPLECPFHIKPEPHFRGVQSDAGAFSLNVEWSGLVQARRSEGTWGYGGGAVGRLLVSRGYGAMTVMLGNEFAGGAMVRPGTDTVVVNIFTAIPLVLRFQDLSWHYDAELAPVAMFQADDARLSYGLRAGLGLGVQARRTRGIVPWVGGTLVYEHYFAGVRPSAEFLRAGFRVGIVWN
jgi:hypothetical protein